MIWPIDLKNLRSLVNNMLMYKTVPYGYHRGKFQSNQSFNFLFGGCFIELYQLWIVWLLEAWRYL
ncbi:hypothetical protein LINPERPRIM_LOCUS33162 [Linum perenne]